MVSNFDDLPLTRYMSFAKFVDLLSGGLFCTRATNFEDPWEGHVFHSINAKEENRNPLAAFVNRTKEWVYVSCWHSGGADNYAMWKVYGQSHEAVAVHTRLGRLAGLMPEFARRSANPLGVVAVVTYVEPISGVMPKLDPDKSYLKVWMKSGDPNRQKWLEFLGTCLAQKPAGYAYEEEVRLLLLDDGAPALLDGGIVDTAPETPPGYRIEIKDMGQFVEKITVAPNAPDWFLNVVRETAARFDISSVPVERSRLFDAAPRPVVKPEYQRR